MSVEMHGHQFQTITIDDFKFEVAPVELQNKPLIDHSVSHAGRVIGYLVTRTGDKVIAYNWSCTEEIGAFDKLGKRSAEAKAILYAIRAIGKRAGLEIQAYTKTPEMAAAQRMGRQDYISECISAIMAMEAHNSNQTAYFDAVNTLAHYKWRLGISDDADQIDAAGFGALSEILAALADQDRGAGRPKHRQLRTGQRLTGLFFRNWRRGHEKQIRSIYSAAWFCDEMRSEYGGHGE